MIILGIDPGTATTGFAIVEKLPGKTRAVNFGVISTTATLSPEKRLKLLAKDLRMLIKKYKPNRASVEKLFFATNQKTAISVAQARGVVLLLLAEASVPTFEYTPLQVKSRISGYGSAGKKQVQFMVTKIFGLKSTPKPDDAADALAVAWCACNER